MRPFLQKTPCIHKVRLVWTPRVLVSRPVLVLRRGHRVKRAGPFLGFSASERALTFPRPADGSSVCASAWLTVWFGVCQWPNTMDSVHNGPASLPLECKTRCNGFRYSISAYCVTRASGQGARSPSCTLNAHTQKHTHNHRDPLLVSYLLEKKLLNMKMVNVGKIY